ncbi:glutamyl-Q tRNA(Asp) ligase, partial [Salmonella enterica subsp. enterica serovar Infantis]
MTDSHYIG